MVEMRRGPGRPAYDSKQKLVAAACALLAERGFEATSPQMFQQRSGIGHGSMYHHFPGKGKEGLALDAISHMRASTIAFLDGSPTPSDSEPEVRASIVTALDRLFARKEGQALVRLLADAVAGAIPSLATATRDWCDDILATIVVRLRADEPGTDLDIADAAAQFLAPEFDALAEKLFTAALGRGLLHLPKFALPEAGEER
ncbi:MAG: TetR/AcrR family transcriptional regulator [Propioniciclava sp.]|jgi:AcrR family transcriptional regulator